MNVFLLLDVLLLILVALFVPIGFWRGAQREILVTLGILFGASLAEWWARPWGQDLASMTSLREGGGAFMVAVLFLIGSTFLLGYGTGAALPVPPPGLISRLFGGLIAGANGALLLSFALRMIRVYLLPDQSSGFLDRATFAHFLSTGVGWLLLGAAVLFVPIVVLLALFGRDVTVEIAEYDEPDDAYEEEEYMPASRRFPPRSPAGSFDDRYAPIYKTEPPPSSRYSSIEETRSMAVPPPQRSTATLGGEHRDEPTDEHIVIAQAETTSDDAQATLQMRREEPSPAADESLKNGKCPGCHADVRDAEVFCPRCGRVL